jgi:DegV family protein with EDD domain
MSGYLRPPAWEDPSRIWNASPTRDPARVQVVTDSTATILPSHAQALGIVVVPNRILMQGRFYRDAIDLTAAQFYAWFPRVGLGVETAPASAEDFYSTYQWAFARGATAIVSIHASRRVSQVFSNALAARDALAPAVIDVIDSRLVGVGMWPAVVRAAKLANIGASPQTVHEQAVAVLARTRLYTLLESLDYVRHGGRSPRAVHLLGRAMNALPILTYQDGEAVPVESVRTRQHGLQRMRDLALGQGAIESLLVCGTSAEWIAQMEAVLVEEYHGPLEKTWLSPTVGVHTGPSIAIGIVQSLDSGRQS